MLTFDKMAQGTGVFFVDVMGEKPSCTFLEMAAAVKSGAVVILRSPGNTCRFFHLHYISAESALFISNDVGGSSFTYLFHADNSLQMEM